MGPKPSDKASSSHKKETGGRKNWTDEEHRQLVQAHNAAVTTVNLAFNSEEYWRYLAEKSATELAQVRRYWVKTSVYTEYAIASADADSGDGWTDEKTQQVVRAHNHAVATMHFVFDSDQYWEHIAERVQKPLEEVRKNWRKNSNYKDYCP